MCPLDFSTHLTWLQLNNIIWIWSWSLGAKYWRTEDTFQLRFWPIFLLPDKSFWEFDPDFQHKSLLELLIVFLRMRNFTSLPLRKRSNWLFPKISHQFYQINYLKIQADRIFFLNSGRTNIKKKFRTEFSNNFSQMSILSINFFNFIRSFILSEKTLHAFGWGCQTEEALRWLSRVFSNIR